jgi:hypothetical protein
MADLRTLIETKILSKSDRGLEKIGGDGSNNKNLQHTVINVKTKFYHIIKFEFLEVNAKFLFKFKFS